MSWWNLQSWKPHYTSAQDPHVLKKEWRLDCKWGLHPLLHPHCHLLTLPTSPGIFIPELCKTPLHLSACRHSICFDTESPYKKFTHFRSVSLRPVRPRTTRTSRQPRGIDFVADEPFVFYVFYNDIVLIGGRYRTPLCWISYSCKTIYIL